MQNIPKLPGIYLIRNKMNNLIYVGKSINLYNRSCQYNSIMNGKNPSKLYNKRFINHMIRFGKENFEFLILEILPYDDEILAEREYYWMNYYQSFKKEIGYNLILDSSTRLLVSNETKQKISKRLKNEWKSGIRKNHGKKLSDSWKKRGEIAKIAQGKTFSKILTKYKYLVIYPNGLEELVFYKELKERKLQNVIAEFHRKNIDEYTRKTDGITIKRINIEDIVQTSKKFED